MTTEPTPPQQAGPNPAFRRRRRKHKGPSNGPQSSQPSSQAQQPGQVQQSQPSQEQAHNHSRSNGVPRTHKPGKKRFFKKQSGGPNPGNQQKRSRQARQPRTFVGPMDHSYLVANGNYAEAPPSTIELQRGNSNGNFSGNYNGLPKEDPAQAAPPSAVPAAETPTRIYCFIEDLFFQAKIQETARKLGVKVAFMKNDKDIVKRLAEAVDVERPALIVFDLNNVSAKPLTLIPKIKTKLKRTASVIGFLSHLQGDLKVKATEAGCDTVMPRSAFSQNLPVLLRRYGLEEEFEHMGA
ncbi:MAG: response regulator [Acidobacteriaceae bacterium]